MAGSHRPRTVPRRLCFWSRSLLIERLRHVPDGWCGRTRVVDIRPERRLKSQGTGHSTDYDPTKRHSTWLTPALQEDESADAPRSSDTDDCYSAAINRCGRPAR